MTGITEDKIAATVSQLINRALAGQATAVHFEPRQHLSVVRVRSHGELQDAAKLPKQLHQPLVEYLNHLAGNNEAFNHTGPEGSTLVRVHSLPVMDGQKVVLHLIPHQTATPNLAELGFWGRAVNQIEHALSEPHGVIQAASLQPQVANRTLHSLASMLQSSQHSIASIAPETDHLSIDGINHFQIPQHEQAERLRHALRQDSDVILAGTVIDPAAVELAYEVGLTNRLILSSMYADSTVQLSRRLLDMGIGGHLIAAGLRLVIAQRLVRRLCPACREAFAPSAAQLKKLAAFLEAKAIADQAGPLEVMARAAGIGADLADLSSDQSTIHRLWKASRIGCHSCNFSGYAGRLTICEVLPVSPPFQRAIVTNRPAAELRQAAIASGMISLQWDGFIKALRGQIGLEELFSKQYR